MVWRQVKKPESNACPITYLWFQTIFIPLISWKTVRNQKFPLSQNPDTLLCCVWYKVTWPHHLKMPCHKWYVLRNNWGTLSSKVTTQTGIMESESIWMQETTHAHKKCTQERRRTAEATGTSRWQAIQQMFQLPACQAYQCKIHKSIPKGRQFRVFASLTSVTESFWHFAISLTRQPAMDTLCSLRIAANLWSVSALFHRGVFAQIFCAALALSTHLFTSSWVQAAGTKRSIFMAVSS